MRHVFMRELPPKREARQFDGSLESYEKIRQWIENSRPTGEAFFRPPNEDQPKPFVIIQVQKSRIMLSPGTWLIWDNGEWQSHTEAGIQEWFEIIEEVYDDAPSGEEDR